MPKVAFQWIQGVLRVLYQRRRATRSEIARETGLNPASVSLALQHLINRGMIVKIGELDSGGGRKADLLKLNDEAAYFLALDLDSSRIRFAVTNFVGDIRYRWEEDFEFGDTLTVEHILKGIKMTLRSVDPEDLPRIVAAGVSHPGITDEDGRVTAYNVGWRRVDLRREFEKAIEMPFYLDTSQRVFVLAERWLGQARNTNSSICVITGNGVGAGIFCDGMDVLSRDKLPGEIGHVIIDPNATDRCKCGKRGCLESIVSSPNIVRQYLEKTGQSSKHPYGSQVTEVFEQARRGDTKALEVLERVSKTLGLGLSYLVNLFNPEIIIIGGDLIRGEDLLLPQIREEVSRFALEDFTRDLVISFSSLGVDIGLKGAVSLAFRSVLEDSVMLDGICPTKYASDTFVKAG